MRLGNYLLIYRFSVSQSGSAPEYDVIDVNKKNIKTMKAKNLCFFAGRYNGDKFFFYDTGDGKLKIGKLKY